MLRPDHALQPSIIRNQYSVSVPTCVSSTTTQGIVEFGSSECYKSSDLDEAAKQFYDSNGGFPFRDPEVEDLDALPSPYLSRNEQ